MSTASWFYASGEERVGPYSAADLVQFYDVGQLPGETYVWRDGMDDWVTLSQVIGELRASSVGNLPAPPPPKLSTPSATSPYAAPDSFLAGNSTIAPAVAIGAKASPYGPYKSPRTRATVTVVMLSLSLFVSIIMGVSSYMQLNLLDDFANGAYEGRQDEYMEVANANDLRVGLIAAFYVVVFIGCVVTWCMWTHRVMRNAWSFANPYNWLETSPGWAVGWFFIPIASLWKPFGALSQAWRATVDPQKGHSIGAPGILGAWWTAWIITNIFGNIAFRVSMAAGDSLDALRMTTKVNIADELIGLVVTPLAILVVLKLTKLQQERNEQSIA